MRYRQRDWDQFYQGSCGRMRSMFEINAPKKMVADEARMMLNAVHGGPWRAVLALARHEIKSAFGRYAFTKWEWARTRVMRRIPDPVLDIAERVAAEDREVCKLINEL